jgi:hypothetical protein
MQVIQKIVLDDIALITTANNKVVEAMMRVQLHNVPDNRPAADFDQRLGNYGCLFAQPGSMAAGKNDNLHGKLPVQPIRVGQSPCGVETRSP